MNAADLFVGGVAVGLGLAALLAAVLNIDVGFRLPKAQAIESRWGRRGARICYALLGAALLLLGAAIIAGYAPLAQRGAAAAATP
ncbi:MAG: hypothetical protein KDA41_09765 [Planctomycetales bacterium]|nr:hypothetical protein [Planctomycetales bacterium]